MNSASAKKRLKIIIGQINGIITMMEGNEDCDKIIPQVKAVKNAFASFSREAGKCYLQDCVQKHSGDEKKLHAIIDMISKF